MDSHDAGTARGTGDTGPGRVHAHTGIPAVGAHGHQVGGAARCAHPVAHALDGITSLLAGVAGVPLWTLDATDTADLLTRAAHAEAALAGLRLALYAPGPAKADLRLARALTGRYPMTAAALGAGTVTAEQARVIVRAVDALPSNVGELARGDAEAHLIELAADFDPVELARLGRRVLDVIAPEEADRLLGEQLAREEARAQARVFHRRPDGHGGCHLSGHLDAEAAALLDAALDPLAAPHPTGTDGPDNRSPGRRHADALVELARRALAGAATTGGLLPDTGGEPTPLIITVGLQALRSGLGAPCCPPGTSSPPRRPAGWPATPASSPPSSTPSACPWTWAGPAGCSPPPHAAPSSSATAAAPSPGGHSPIDPPSPRPWASTRGDERCPTHTSARQPPRTVPSCDTILSWFPSVAGGCQGAVSDAGYGAAAAEGAGLVGQRGPG
jgi:Domain of unknown function (DUF222)